MDILDCLQTDHDAIKSGVIDLLTMEQDTGAKVLAFRQLASLVDAHAKAEEAVVLSYAQGQRSLRGVALEILEEHDLTEELANSIRKSSESNVDPEHLDAKVKVYCDLLGHHLTEVEQGLFPELHERLTDEEREEMGRRYARCRSLGQSPTAFEGSQKSGAMNGMMPHLMNEAGRVGYLLAWMLGVPAWILLVVALIN